MVSYSGTLIAPTACPPSYLAPSLMSRSTAPPLPGSRLKKPPDGCGQEGGRAVVWLHSGARARLWCEAAARQVHAAQQRNGRAQGHLARELGGLSCR